MQKFSLDDITFQNRSVAEKLQRFLFVVSQYDNFDTSQPIRIFVNKDKDFTALESVKYNFQFTSSAHKLIETIKSPFACLETDFESFRKLLSYKC